MASRTSIDEVTDLAKSYLDGRLSGRELVRGVDDLVSQGYAQLFDSATNTLIDEFQDQLALYVPDEETKREAPGVYFCEDQLITKVQQFLNKLSEGRKA